MVDCRRKGGEKTEKKFLLTRPSIRKGTRGTYGPVVVSVEVRFCVSIQVRFFVMGPGEIPHSLEYKEKFFRFLNSFAG